MSVAVGSRLGPYEIVAPVGAGGMGEVYRARDSRLGRDVAVKVLPAGLSADPERLTRFEQEARAASALNHPNILAIYDVGSDAGIPYLVSELLEGESLRSRLGVGALPARKLVELATQVASAVAAAHDKGIVHRDLKPENIFVTRDGRVKILDFGLAKLAGNPGDPAAADLATAGPDTLPGMLLGTVGYMSPEQIRGRPADARSDIFAIGAILYEMATGKRAFHKESAPETMTAILTEDPPALDVADAKLPPGLARIVSHCLEKIPEERFQSARDLAFGLQALSGTSATAASSAPAPAVRARRRRVLMAAGALGLVLAAVIVAFVLGRWTAAPAPIVFKRVTFRHGTLSQGRFTGDGRAIIYSARWGTSPEQLFLTNIGNPETRPFDLPVLQLLAVAPSGELAVMLHPDFQGGFIFTGTLARVPAAGGAPREILEAVQAAEWGPDSQSLAIVRNVAGTSRLEYPIGHVLFNTAGWINFPRLSPNGDAIAFLHHPLNGDDAGEVVVVDLAGNARRISSGWLSAEGLAWSGNEVWFTATATGQERRIYAATTTGSVRFVAGGTGSLTLYDVAKDGRLLVSRDSDRIGIAVRGPGDAQERDLSWLDWSLIRQVSEDGRTIVFDETGEGGGQRQGVFVRGLDGSPAVRLGDGTAPALSKDGRWVACVQGHPPRLVILPTGPGEARSLPTPGLQTQSVHWFPDGTRLLLAAAAPGHALRYYVQSLTGGTARPVTPEGASIFTHGLSDSGRLLLTSIAGTFGLFDVETGARRDVTMLKPSDRVVRMVGETSAYVTERNRLPTDLSLVDLTTGRRTVVGTIGTSKTAAVPSTFGVAVSADGHTYAYSYLESTSELYVVEEVPR